MCVRYFRIDTYGQRRDEAACGGKRAGDEREEDR